MSEENKALIQRFVEEAFNKGNLGVADEVYASSFIAHDPTIPEGQGSPEVVKQFVGTYLSALIPTGTPP